MNPLTLSRATRLLLSTPGSLYFKLYLRKLWIRTWLAIEDAIAAGDDATAKIKSMDGVDVEPDTLARILESVDAVSEGWSLSCFAERAREVVEPREARLPVIIYASVLAGRLHRLVIQLSRYAKPIPVNTLSSILGVPADAAPLAAGLLASMNIVSVRDGGVRLASWDRVSPSNPLDLMLHECSSEKILEYIEGWILKTSYCRHILRGVEERVVAPCS